MRWLGFRVYLDPEALGSIEGECPACRSAQRFTRHRLWPRWIAFLVLYPSDELLACCGCGAVSRDESLLDRLMSAIFLVPFLLVLGAGTGTGLWLALSMADQGQFAPSFLLIAAMLVGAGGYAGWRVLRTLGRLLAPRRKLPMAGWGTAL